MSTDLENWTEPTAEQWADWTKQAEAHHKYCLKLQLHWAYVTAFVKPLSDKVKWQIVEEFETTYMKRTSEDFTVSTKRYTTPAQLTARAVTAVYNTLQPREAL